MSYIETIKATQNKAGEMKKFYGLNRTENTRAGEFGNMYNMSSDKYPYITPCKPTEKSDIHNRILTTVNGEDVITYAQNIRAVIAPPEEHETEGFTGVAGTDFYYNGRKKTMKVPMVYKSDGSPDYGMEIAADGKIQLLRSNRIIIIHGYGCRDRKPYTYYYDTKTLKDTVSSYEYENPIRDYTLDYGADGNGEIKFKYKTTLNFSGGYWDFAIGDSIFIDDFMTYSDSRWDDINSKSVISAIVTDVKESYEGFMNGEFIWNITAKFSFKNPDGNSPFSNSDSKIVKHIYRKIPYMTHLAIHKGRLWGANPNGEYIYASALGKIFNFNSFEGLSGDSVFMESSSGESYLGMVSCSDVIAAFKKDQIEIIYGDLPEEFAVGRIYTDCGCSDIASCVVIDSAIYFLSEKGFCVWKGLRPVVISKVLDKNYSEAFAFTDGFKYYTSAYDGEKYENLVYDPEYGIWHKEGDSKINGYYKKDGEKYICSESEIYCLEGKGTIEWSAESIKYFNSDYELNHINEMWVFAKLCKNSEIKVYISADDGEWILCDEIKSEKNESYSVYRIPVRIDGGFYYRYKLSGKGDCVICGVRMISDKSGRVYNNKRGD